MSRLPVDAVLPDLLSALDAQSSAVLIAPPGAGKTTRVPLALLKAAWRGDGKIIVLEPRRLAARSAARFAARSLGEKPGETVGYRVRMETRVSARTRVELVTEGVFTRMIQSDPELTGIAAVLFDEFHERNLDGDLGLALALDAQSALRPDLRILVMSATVDGARVASLLGDAPVIESKGRSFPVETRHVARRPEIQVADQLADTCLDALGEETGSVLAFLPGRYEIDRAARRLEERLPADTDLAVLYGALTGADQDRAIAPAPKGRRKLVLATSIAETSLTIEGVRVVVDSGFSRQPRYEPATGLTRLETVRVSKAGADQRRGRAGRLEPGICVRLWAEAQTGALAAFDRPEILEADLAGLVLDLAQWGVADPTDLKWLDPPPAAAWSEAVALLRDLEALDAAGRITETGRDIAGLPLHPRLAHMIVRAAGDGEAPLAAEIAVLLSERNLGGRSSDLVARLRAFRADRSPRARASRKLAQGWSGRFDDQRRNISADRCGAILARAYPDRIAQARGASGGFRLANGRGGRIETAEALAAEPFLVVAELQGRAADARILLAAPISKAELETDFEAAIEEAPEIVFDRKEGTVRAFRIRRLKALELGRVPDPRPDPDAVALALRDGILALGIAALPWSKAQTALRDRVAWLHPSDPEGWPDLSDNGLSKTANQWLTPFLAGRTAIAELTPTLLDAGLATLLPADGMRRLDRLAPKDFVTPLGRTIAIDYSTESGPTVSVRVQELYGLDRHPTVGEPPVPLVLSLLSPADRPIQLTADLSGFWRGSWRDVRADMRGRYPKHVWPEEPQSAEATRSTRRKS